MFCSPKITLQEICNKIFAYSYSGIWTIKRTISFFAPSFVLCAAKRNCSQSFVTAFFVEMFSFFALLGTFNPFSPKSDQHQISPCNIDALQNRVVMRITDVIKMNLLDILSTSPYNFCMKWIGTTNKNSNFVLVV